MDVKDVWPKYTTRASYERATNLLNEFHVVARFVLYGECV